MAVQLRGVLSWEGVSQAGRSYLQNPGMRSMDREGDERMMAAEAFCPIPRRGCHRERSRSRVFPIAPPSLTYLAVPHETERLLSSAAFPLTTFWACDLILAQKETLCVLGETRGEA